MGCPRRKVASMIDWEEISRAEDLEEIKKAKLWLFQENIRIENARRELEELSRRTALEQKRLKEELLFFEKKLAILQDGFRKLDEDRRAFERQRRALEERFARQGRDEPAGSPLVEESVRLLFRGTSNPLALRKRYRDLVKIFHPDNLFGDGEMAQSINREYLRRRSREE